MSFPLLAHFTARFRYLRLWSKSAVAFSCVIASHCALAAPQSLTLAAAQQQAVSYSRQLAAQDHAIVAAHEMAIAAGQLPDPVLKMGIDNVPVSGQDRFSIGNDFMTMRRIGLSQEWTRADKLHWRSERQQREAQKAQAQKDVSLAAIQRDTAIAWLELYYTQQLADAVSSQAMLSRQEVEAAATAYRGGRGSSADILAARSALLALDDRGSEMTRRLLVAQTRLARWIGGSGEVTLAGSPDTDQIRLDPATLERDFAHHPKIAVLSKQQNIAQAEVSLAQANLHADWSVELAFQQRGAAYSNMVSVGISVPLQWDSKNRQNRELAAKLALVEQTKAERDEMLRDDLAETRALMVEWQSGRERLSRYAQQWLPLAGERSEAVLASYRGGKGTLADVLAARRNEIEVRTQAIALQMETARLWAQLNYLFPEHGLKQSSAMNSHQDVR